MFIDNLLDNLLTLVVILCTLIGFILYGSLLVYVVAMFQPLSFLLIGIVLIYLGVRSY
jgi:sorbitol-specific phosphotransferase system component IIBC